MQALLLAGVTGLCLTLAGCGGDDGPPDAPDGLTLALSQLDAVVADAMTRSKVPGVAVAVVADGQVRLAKGYGVRDVRRSDRVDADTVFPLASLSKSVGASVVAHQVGIGSVDWNTPITRWMPDFALSDAASTTQVTIGDMYAHRSGLPDHAGDALEDIGYGRDQVLTRLRYVPVLPLRSAYAYTNFGLTAGAQATANAAGEPWETLSARALYAPLDMTRTTTVHAEFLAQDNRVTSHMRMADGYVPTLRVRDADAQAPAGGVSSSARDMGRWLAMVLQEGRYQGREVIAPDALRPALSLQNDNGHNYGYGFGVGPGPDGYRTLSHSGAFLLGAGTNYVALPDLGIGIVVLTNGAPSGAAEAIGAGFLDIFLHGAITQDWYAEFASRMTPLYAPVGELAGQTPPANPRPAPSPEHLVGTYTNAYYGDAVIAPDAGNAGLVLRLGPNGVTTYRLTHWDDARFVFVPVNENSPPGSLPSVQFERDGAGNATALGIDIFRDVLDGRFERRAP